MQNHKMEKCPGKGKVTFCLSAAAAARQLSLAEGACQVDNGSVSLAAVAASPPLLLSSLVVGRSSLVVPWFGGSVVRLVGRWSFGVGRSAFGGSVVRWFVGSLVRWFGGSLVRWFGGSVVRWFGGSVVRWFGRWLLVIRWFGGSVVGRSAFSPVVHCWSAAVRNIAMAVLLALFLLLTTMSSLSSDRWPIIIC